MSDQNHTKFDELYYKAMEERPEQFIPASMPFIKCRINGINLIALIDSGSMITCTNLEIAQKCDLISEMDPRVKVPIMGVGNKVSIGQNYGINIQLGDREIVIPMLIVDISFNECDMIIGLDLLRSFRANLDFQNNKLVLNSLGSTFSTNILSDNDKKQFLQIRKLIEVSNGRVDEDGAFAYLLKHNFDFDASLLDIVSS